MKGEMWLTVKEAADYFEIREDNMHVRISSAHRAGLEDALDYKVIDGRKRRVIDVLHFHGPDSISVSEREELETLYYELLEDYATHMDFARAVASITGQGVFSANQYMVELKCVRRFHAMRLLNALRAIKQQKDETNDDDER